MAVRVVCRACGKRLKRPDGPVGGRAARCPKCLAPVDLTPAPEASAYEPTAVLPAVPPASHAVPASHSTSHAGGVRPPLAREVPLSLDDEPLSLDDDPAPAPVAEPFRVPVEIRADSFRRLGGACRAVVVAHGVFLELEPRRPFLYLPVGCRAAAGAGELTVALPDGRTLVLAVGPGPLAADLAAFLLGGRAAPVAADYRRRRFPSALAAVFALAVGVLALGAIAYVAAGRKTAEGPPASSPTTAGVPNPGPPLPPAPPPDPGPTRPPSHLDRAYEKGVSALDDGPADVTALAVAANANHLAIGYADGATGVWPLEQPTFDPLLPGPKADGPVTRVQFDAACKLLFVTTPTGVVVTPRGGSPPAPAKISGSAVAVAPELNGDRLRFAAVRGGVLAHRLLPASFVRDPPAKGKGFAVPAPRDEITPLGVTTDPRLANPTFLAWTPANRLLAGGADGSVQTWSVQMRTEPLVRGHRGPVRVWAACPASGDFATGDDKGAVAVWPGKGGKPVPGPVFNAPVVGLSFSPSGLWLAALDNTGELAILDAATATVLHRKKLPTPVRAFAFGPADDLLVLGRGRAVDVWWLPELLK